MKKYLLSALLVLGLFFIFGQAQALTISPAKIILTADPGETLETMMNVGHGFDQTTNYFPVFEKYTVANGEEPVFYPENFGLPIWIRTDPEVLTLGPGQTKAVRVLIDIPEDAEPGGHYAVIFWSSAAPKNKEKGTSVGIVTRVGALVLLDVSGEVKESAKIMNFKALKKAIWNLPLGFEYEIENSGTVHERPEGEILIKNMFGKTINILQANPGGAYVLPKTTRKIAAENWEIKKDSSQLQSRFQDEPEKGFVAGLKNQLKEFHLGYYQANLAVEYGKKREILRAGFGFWIIPWQVLLIGLFVAGAMSLGGIKIFQRYNQWVISRAEKNLRKKRTRKPKLNG